MTIYNKLIRDRIPEIIEASGRKCIVRKLDDGEYLEKLNEKLEEELKEYLESGEVEELADLVEVIYAILENKGVSMEEFERARLGKKVERGAFREKLLLSEISK